MKPRLLCKRTKKNCLFKVIIPVLEHGKVHFGTGRVSVLKSMCINTPISLINTSMLPAGHFAPSWVV